MWVAILLLAMQLQKPPAEPLLSTLQNIDISLREPLNVTFPNGHFLLIRHIKAPSGEKGMAGQIIPIDISPRG